MNRRGLITLLGGAAILPVAARAQPSYQVRRVGVLLGGDESDQILKARLSWFLQDLGELGWIDGGNLHVEIRWSAGDLSRIRTAAKELVQLQPELVFAVTPAATRALQQETQTIPIVFSGVGDPVAGGFLKNVAKPEGNTTGATNFIPSMGGKWLELLKQAVPRISRIALLFNPDISTGTYFPALEGASSQFAVTLVRSPYRDAADLVHAIDALAGDPGTGLIVLPPAPIGSNRALINRLTVQHSIPTIYQDRDYAVEGGLMSYGTIVRDLWRQSAFYVDRILRGAKPADLPVQFPTKFELVVNLKTAKNMGLTVPESFLLRADEVVE